MTKKTNLISNLLSERSNFILIGLTGRTGSGCTTTAGLMSKDNLTYPKQTEVYYNSRPYFDSMDARRYEIVKKYAEKNTEPFKVIKISDIIGAMILNVSIDVFKNFIKSVIPRDFHEKIDGAIDKSKYREFSDKLKKIDGVSDYLLNSKRLGANKVSSLQVEEWLGVIGGFTQRFKMVAKENLNNKYITIFQSAGDSIRRTGKILPSYREEKFNPEGLFTLPRVVNRLIKFYRQHDKRKDNKSRQKTYIVIDAIRNPYEAKYFKDRYAAFNLVSINAPSNDRKKYLQEKYKYTFDQIDEMEKRESGKISIDKKTEITKCNTCGSNSGIEIAEDKYEKLILSNVQKCIEISDIHLFNPRNEPGNTNVLRAQLAWYLSLLKHPGLVTPTALERVMQMAYTAKMNSGCISRQVGAVVTDRNYSIKAVGWNDVPKGQVPCNLRSLDDLKNYSSDTDYSTYELNSKEFREESDKELQKIKHLEKQGRNLSYCFKSIQNKVDGEKNQVHTRSLHAEENAFLQLSKYGGVGIEGGKLFTTASPCELCAKKAYQMGVKEIVFIDPYPGIAIQHIISIGTNAPDLVQFRGAVGKAYHNLYEPLMPYKDELDYLALDS